MNKLLITLTLFLCFFAKAWAYPQYYCTGANSDYFKSLINLIGSIQKHNYENLVEIAVFDLGMTRDEIKVLKTIRKVRVHSIKENNPNLLSRFTILDRAHSYLGWYAWKPVVIKEILETLPYVLWLDAGCEVLKPLDDLFAHIEREGYFLLTTGEGKANLLHPIKWGTTEFVKNAFNLSSPENAWVLDEEFTMSGFVGLSKKSADLFLNQWYELTKDIRNFADDGTAGGGWAACRHDQTLLSIISLLGKLKIHNMDGTFVKPIMIIGEENKEVPFYITWVIGYQREKASAAVQVNCYGYEDHLNHIRYKYKRKK